MPSWVLGPRLTLGYVVAALAVAIAGFTGMNQILAAREAGDAARHIQDVLGELARLEIALLDSETGQRGYLLTAEEGYLEPYERGRVTTRSTLERLERLTEGSPSQHERVARLTPLVDAKLLELERTLRLRKNEGLDAALRLVRTHVGQVSMEAIRGVLKEAADEERALLERRLTKRGSRFWWAGRVTMLASGIALMVVALSTFAVNRNVRRREATQRQLRESRQRLSVTLQSIGDAVIATDPGGRVVFLNNVAANLTGWSEEEARGRPLDDIFRIVNEYTRNTVESPVTKVLRAGVILGLANHTVLLNRNGAETPIDDSGAPIRDGDGEIMGVVLVFRDVTDRKLQEESLERLRQEEMARLAAENANRTKDEFLAILSHELRSPLQGIVGWLTVLGQPHLDRDKQLQAIKAIERGVRQQTQLVNDILDTSRIVTGKLRIERDSVPIAPLVRECVEQALPMAREKDITLFSSVDDCGIALGDRYRLSQSLGNILANAIKFTPSGGRIEISCLRDGDGAVIMVCDSGEGIAPEFLPHIFDRFTQGETRSRRASGGLGLGLSIVRQIIEAHGGSVHAESPGLGRGSIFTLRVPTLPPDPSCETAAPAESSAQAAMQDGLDSVSILVVDDDVETREPLALLLAMRGANVSQADSVAAALAVVAAKSIDAIVSDIAMPEQDGYALIQSLPEKGNPARPIAIALTGFASAEDRQRASAAGFDAHVAKPFDFDILTTTIATLVRRRAAA